MIRENYHTHTYRCRHAQGDVDDYLSEAERQGLAVLGFSEHMPTPDKDFNHPKIHMPMSEVPRYVDSVRAAASRWDTVDVRLGGECDYLKLYHNYYLDELLGENGFDYLLLSTHFIDVSDEWIFFDQLVTAKQLAAYTDQSITAMQSGLFSCFVHPDCFMLGYGIWDDQARSCTTALIEAAKEYDVLLELNSKGFRLAGIDDPKDMYQARYPNRNFWEMVASINPVALFGSDAHMPSLVGSHITLCETFVKDLGITLMGVHNSHTSSRFVS